MSRMRDRGTDSPIPASTGKARREGHTHRGGGRTLRRTGDSIWRLSAGLGLCSNRPAGIGPHQAVKGQRRHGERLDSGNLAWHPATHGNVFSEGWRIARATACPLSHGERRHERLLYTSRESESRVTDALGEEHRSGRRRNPTRPQATVRGPVTKAIQKGPRGGGGAHELARLALAANSPQNSRPCVHRSRGESTARIVKSCGATPIRCLADERAPADRNPTGRRPRASPRHGASSYSENRV